MAIAGIVSASVVPDTYFQTVFDIAAVEAENIPTSKLGEWLGKQHHQRLAKLMEEAGYGHILKKYTLPQDIQEWYEGELQRRHEQLREHLDTPKESFYRTELESFRSMFHKPVIYATWDWSSTVEDALHQAGFTSFEEQAAALEEYRKDRVLIRTGLRIHRHKGALWGASFFFCRPSGLAGLMKPFGSL